MRTGSRVIRAMLSKLDRAAAMAGGAAEFLADVSSGSSSTSCSVAIDGSLSPDSFRAGRMPMPSEFLMAAALVARSAVPRMR